MSKSYRIYGPLNGETSWSRVARGIYEGIKAHREAHFFKTDDVGHSIDTPLRTGHDADVGIYVGVPNRAGMMMGQGEHRERWLMLAPNSTWLPRDVLYELERVGAVTGYLSPSDWGTGIIQRYTDLPVRCFPHGIDVRRMPKDIPGALPDDKPFEVLHLSSTHLERKGTSKLVAAWTEAMALGKIPAESRLHLVLDGPGEFVHQKVDEVFGGMIVGSLSLQMRRNISARGFVSSRALLKSSVITCHRINADTVSLARLMREHHCVCQPSRAEGFGMVPLEARAVGVPVIMTDGTGHDMHVPVVDTCLEELRADLVSAVMDYLGLDDDVHDLQDRHSDELMQCGIRVVPQHGESLIDDGPGALAPDFETKQLVDALHDVYTHRDKFREGAAEKMMDVRDVWCWEQQAGAFLEGLD